MEGVLRDLVRANPEIVKSLLLEMASDAGPSTSGAVDPSPEPSSVSNNSNSTDREESDEEPVSPSSPDSVNSGSAPAMKVHKINIKSIQIHNFTNLKLKYKSL